MAVDSPARVSRIARLVRLDARLRPEYTARRVRDPRHNHIIELITRNPAEIAWFYVHTVGGGARSSLAIHIWRTNGKCIALNMIREELGQALAELACRAPHAPRTFSGETQRLYRADPTRWRPTAS